MIDFLNKYKNLQLFDKKFIYEIYKKPDNINYFLYSSNLKLKINTIELLKILFESEVYFIFINSAFDNCLFRYYNGSYEKNHINLYKYAKEIIKNKYRDIFLIIYNTDLSIVKKIFNNIHIGTIHISLRKTIKKNIFNSFYSNVDLFLTDEFIIYKLYRFDNNIQITYHKLEIQSIKYIFILTIIMG